MIVNLELSVCELVGPQPSLGCVPARRIHCEGDTARHCACMERQYGFFMLGVLGYKLLNTPAGGPALQVDETERMKGFNFFCRWS